METTVPIIRLPRPSRLVEFVQSRIRSLDIEPETVGQIVSQYGLTLVTAPKNLPNTRRNRNLIVNTSAGKKILKLYRKDWRVSTIVFEHSILAHLACLDFPAPRLAVAQNGHTFIQQRGKHYALFNFIDGINYSSNFLLRSQRLRLTATAGMTLARLHKQLSGFLPEGQHHLGFGSYESGNYQDIAWRARKLIELKEKTRNLVNPQDRAHARWLVDKSNFILEELERLDEALSRVPLLRTIIHGDYGLHNLLFKGMWNATPVDFELARLEWRLSDLASCLSRLRFSGGEYDFESIRCFMDAYQTEFPLSEEEQSVYPEVWSFYKLRGAVQYWSSFFETGGPTRKLISARDAVGQAEWTMANPEKILSLSRNTAS